MMWVAFLRGINVGGHKPIKMDALKKMFESLRNRNVATVLASGNVVFETTATSAPKIAAEIENKLKQSFGYEIGVMVRTIDQIRALSKADPFKRTKITPNTRLYVTFLSEKPTTKLRIPYTSPEKDFQILRVSPSEVCSALTVSPGRGTTEAMKILEKEFGRNLTTRNWNTVGKILAVADKPG
jgi:uncharacterized protein (DUF1697 family)